MLNGDGLVPGLYRVTLDDGTTGDYELTGHSRLDHGDFLTFQPTAVGEIALDAQLAVSRIALVVDAAGEVWRVPGNRLQEAEPLAKEDLDRLAAAYLRQAPFYPPTTAYEPRTALEELGIIGLLPPAQTEDTAEEPVATPRRNRKGSDPETPETTPEPVAATPDHSDHAHASEELVVNVEDGAE